MSVLIIGYRRKKEIKLVIKSISRFKPKKLYIAMDGPKDEEAKILCKHARETAIKAVDWDCDIKTKFNTKNIGTDFVTIALDWFFLNEKEGLILEDDVLIHPDFPKFSKRFIKNKNICCISACTFEDELKTKIHRNKYAFKSYIPSIWGWYTSKSTWQEFRNFKRERKNPISYYLNLRKKIGFWQSLLFAMCLDYIDRGKLDGWDYEFTYFAITNNKSTIFPGICMAQNIGNSELAEHCNTNQKLSPNINPYKINFKELIIEPKLDRYYMRKQTMNIMMKSEYKVQALKGFISYLLKKIIKKAGGGF